MSGLDECGVKLVRIPDGPNKGEIPEYWCFKDWHGRTIAWLVQKPSIGTKWRSAMLVNPDYDYRTWRLSFLDEVRVVESVTPNFFETKDKDFIAGLVKIMLDENKKTGWQAI